MASIPARPIAKRIASNKNIGKKPIRNFPEITLMPTQH